MGRIHIEIANRQRVMAVDERALRRTVRRVCRCRGVAAAEISVAVVDDAAIRRLKKQYFGMAVATDVISFNLSPQEKWTRRSTRLEAEIVINAQLAKRTARRMRSEPIEELHLYLIHGLLHQLGYDDRTETLSRKMHRAEARILRELGYNTVMVP